MIIETGDYKKMTNNPARGGWDSGAVFLKEVGELCLHEERLWSCSCMMI